MSNYFFKTKEAKKAKGMIVVKELIILPVKYGTTNHKNIVRLKIKLS